ncbi:MAG TPA: hypothetical protein VLG09_03220 [Candidatus Saccharimonadales bacterium]|nr:hypothetical protein [Candidatus Saccharimonadales bacterium]
MFVTSTATAALALALAACGGSDAPSGDKEPAKAASTAPGKVTPDTGKPTTAPSASPTVSSDPRFSSDEVCAQLPARRIHDALNLKPGQKVTPTDITADVHATGDDPLKKRDPSLCTYNLPVEPNFVAIGVGTGSDASEAWATAKARNKARFRNDLGGDEVADAGDGIYLVHKGDKLITIQGILSGLSTTDLERVVREAAVIL